MKIKLTLILVILFVTLNSCIISASDFVVDFTIEEFDMLCFVVEREAHDEDVKQKEMVASVIINRVKSDDFPDTIYDVLHQKNQFNTIDNYYNVKFRPTAETIQCVYDILKGDSSDAINGAVYFYAPDIASQTASEWFENELSFSVEYGIHRFFKNK